MDAQEYLEKLKNQVQVIDDPVAKQGAIIITQWACLWLNCLLLKITGWCPRSRQSALIYLNM